MSDSVSEDDAFVRHYARVRDQKARVAWYVLRRRDLLEVLKREREVLAELQAETRRMLAEASAKAGQWTDR